MTFDATIHIGELLVLVGAALTIFRGGVGLRDAVRDMTKAVSRLDQNFKDHEDRIRFLEFGDRRVLSRRKGIE